MKLLLLNIRTTLFRLREQCRVVVRYYCNLPFLLSDLLLCGHYLFRTPHQVSKAFMQARGEKNLYTYGETPLTTLDRIATRAGILSHDVVFEVGCGTGRTSLWLAHFVRCEAVGIDYQQTFIRRAERVKRWLGVQRATFRLEDMLESDFRRASVIYLYGTCLDDATIEQLIGRFLSTPARVISVSYPLSEYSDAYEVIDRFTARYPWGEAEVFINCRVGERRRAASGATGGETAQCSSTHRATPP